MKKILTLIAITAITFTGCITSEESEDAIGNSNSENTEDINNSENTGSSSELIGEWKLSETEDGMTMELNLELKSDGTYSMDGLWVDMGIVMMSTEGTYIVDESAKTLTIKAVNCQEMNDDFVLEAADCEPVSEDDTANYTLNGSTLTITDADDDDTVFEKQ